jgi:predicted nucleotidyltransferase
MSREDLIQRIIDVLQADDRVRATWLSGSLGRGAGDRYSDVDLVAIVAEENRAGFVAEWDGIVATIASVVLTNRLSFRSSTVFNQVTADWLRFDVSVITPASLDRYTASTVRPLFDKDDLYSRLRQKGEPLAPSGPRIQGLTKEFMRILGLLPVVLGREEYAVSASGSGLIRMLLIQLMTEDVAVEDRGGALHLRGLLPDAQLAAIDELPPILATRESAIAVHMAVARLFLPLARDLSKRTGTPWPDALESALRAHLDSQLGLKLSDLSRWLRPEVPIRAFANHDPITESSDKAHRLHGCFQACPACLRACMERTSRTVKDQVPDPLSVRPPHWRSRAYRADRRLHSCHGRAESRVSRWHCLIAEIGNCRIRMAGCPATDASRHHRSDLSRTIGAQLDLAQRSAGRVTTARDPPICMKSDRGGSWRLPSRSG